MRKALLLLGSPQEASLLEAAFPPGWACQRLATGEEGLRRLSEGGADLVVTDLSGERVRDDALFLRIRALAPAAPVLVALPESRRGEGAGYLDRGAAELLALPTSTAEARARLLGVMARFPGRAASGLSELEKLVLTGVSPAVERVREQIAVVARTELPVLLLGESGTGKEVAARQIHQQSRRADGPFVVVNCAAIAESLFEAELFGHVRGAFTGATADRKGLVEESDGGSLFMDDVAELAPPFQAKLLRVMQESEYLRVGDTRVRSLDVRLIYASARDLEAEVASRRLREDFYYRIQVFPIRMPALRERPEDIPLLANYFLRHYCRELGKPFEGLDPEAARALGEHPWPGNIRELQNRMRTAVLYLQGPVFRAEDVPRELAAPSERRVGFARARSDFERAYLTTLLQRHGGNVNRASRESGKQRAELYRMMRRCGITPDQFRRGE